MGSIVTTSRRDTSTGKEVKVFRAHVRRKGFISKSRVFYAKREAQDWLRDNEATPTLTKLRHGKTLKQLIEDFVRLSGCKWPKFSQLEFWKDQLGEMRVADITHANINGAITTLRAQSAMRKASNGAKPTGQKLTPATVNRYIATLSKVLAFALDQGVIDVHPMKGGRVRKLKENGGRTRILTEDEEQRLYKAARGSAWPMMGLFLRMLFSTGARKSEVLNLTWNQIKLEERIAVLSSTKNGRPRSLPLVADVREALVEAAKVRPLKGDFVFFDPQRPERPKTIDSVWNACRAEARLLNDRDDPLDRVVLHTTRHTAVTKLLRGGANLAQAAAVSGHQTLAMLKRYEHLAAQDAVDLAEKLLGNGAGGRQ
jgi:integrase